MNTQLWNEILAFDFDNPVSEYGFSTRLANENFWTKDFTNKAILEYKKFMYLAATCELMVSPSEVVDIVWHQHLIFTVRYAEFCEVLQKQIQHIPSTHNKAEYEKFRQAKERTKKLYVENFGTQPIEIWEYSGMYQSLELNKAKLKIRTFIILGILAFVCMIIPFYFLLVPLYIQIGNPNFIIGFILVSAFTLMTLEFYNRIYLKKLVHQFNDHSFIYYLQPSELIYLKTQNLANVVHGTINRLVEKNHIRIYEDFSIENKYSGGTCSFEEHQALAALDSLGTTHYPNLLNNLMSKPAFGNVKNCMDALKKYLIKSKIFGQLFYSNFLILSLLLMLAVIRLATGLTRDKPVAQILIVVIVLTVIIIGYLWRLTSLICKDSIPNFYKKTAPPTANDNNDWEWRYFLLGSSVFTASFIPVVNYTYNTVNNSSADGSSCGSSGGDSGGSSCGSSCGGCGGD